MSTAAGAQPSRQPDLPPPPGRESTSPGRTPEPELWVPAQPNLLTIDVEDYFHASGLAVDRSQWDRLPGRVEYTTRLLLRILAEHNTYSTFFVLGWVADRYPQLVREIHAAGHEIASHGWHHDPVYDLAEEAFRRDVTRAKDLLEDLTGQPVFGYRAPSFTITRSNTRALETLARAGYRYDSSVYPIRRARYGDSKAPRSIHRILAPADDHDGLLEVPPSTVRILGKNAPVAGGGYFRAYPLWLTRWAIHHLNEVEDRPAVVYLHPWEIDPDQPRMPATAANRFRHYFNLHRTEDRLRTLLGEMSFGTVRDSLGLATTLPAARRAASDRVVPATHEG